MNWTFFLFWTLSVDPSETTATVEPIGEDYIHWKPAGIPDGNDFTIFLETQVFSLLVL